MEQFEGLVEEIIFRNEQNGYTVMNVRIGRDEVAAVGVIPFVSEGERVLLSGEWTEHATYGRQIKVSGSEVITPSTLGGIERYLASGLIAGIGPATAKLIVQEFGEKALSVLEHEPGRLMEVPGIGPKRAEMITASFAEQVSARRAMLFMQSYGITPALAVRIHRVYGDRVEQVIRGNPYRLVDEVHGVGFKTADRIARSIGIPPESEHRIRSGLLHALQEAAQSQGHMYLPYDTLLLHARHLLSLPNELLDTVLRRMILSQELIQNEVLGERAVYARRLYMAEVDVAKRMMLLMREARSKKIPNVESELDEYQKSRGLALSAAQREAVIRAAEEGMIVVTGGPGTGKTTSVNCMLHFMEDSGQEVMLAAPTGRAAKRLSESTGREAKTLHRLLEYGGDEGAFGKDAENPLECDTLIIDEVSMVDIYLMQNVLTALRPGTRLIMVGDADQLPSVGAGNVLRDIIESGAVPCVRLTQIFRQAQESMIVVNAHRINGGEPPQFNNKGSDFFLQRVNAPAEIGHVIAQLLTTRLPRFLNLDPLKDIQVLSPMKKGDAGVWQLNKLLQDQLNPFKEGKAQRQYGEMTLRTGDKVMQVKNNYGVEWTRGAEEGQGVFNGDIGFVTCIDQEEMAVTIEFDDGRVAQYDDGMLEEIELAYCVTVHKSQGSEFPAVVMPMVSGPPMLMTRNLLYTAVTRARRLVVLVGQEEVAQRMAQNNHIAKRYSALFHRLSEVAQMMGMTGGP